MSGSDGAAAGGGVTPGTAEASQQMPLDDFCNQVRDGIEKLKPSVKCMRDHPVFRGEQARQWQHHDMRANIELAYRALEDARMRLGKVIQESGDGVSKYDKK